MKSFLIADILGQDLNEETEQTGDQLELKRNTNETKGEFQNLKNQEKRKYKELSKDETLPRWRRKFSDGQTTNLEEVFTRQKYITGKERAEIAGHLDLTTKQVKTWFQNRRTKWKRERQKFINFEMFFKNDYLISSAGNYHQNYTNSLHFQEELMDSNQRQREQCFIPKTYYQTSDAS